MKLKIISNATYVFRCCQINIIPGVNIIDNNEDFINHPLVQARIQTGALKIEGHKQESNPKIKIKDKPLIELIAGLNSRDTIKEVRLNNNLIELKSLLLKEDRNTVIEVLTKRIKSLELEDNSKLVETKSIDTIINQEDVVDASEETV